MGNYNRDSRSDHRFRRDSNSFRGRRTNNARGSQDRQLFPAVCDNCGKECEVPFKPSGDKPIHCNDCFRKMNPSQDHGRKFGFERRSEKRYGEYQNPSSNNQEVIEQLNALNNKFEILLKAVEAINSEMAVIKGKIEKS